MRRKPLLLLGLLLVTVAAHWRVLQNDFVNYDDNDYVTANPVVQKGLSLEGVKWAFTKLHGEKTYWHPLTWLSHMADCQFFGLKPAGHHAMSLLWHTLNVLLLFLVFERMTGAFWRSAIVAALWAVHPLQVDTVAWVSERKNLLATFFWLLSLAAYVRYAARPGPVRYLLVPLGMALGLMCKPILVTLPCALLLLDFWPLRRWQPRGGTPAPAATAPAFARRSLRQLVLEKVPLLMLAVISSFITIRAHEQLGIRDEVFGLTTSLKLQNAVVSYVRYIDNALWPAKLTVLYLHPGEWPGATVVWSAAVLLAVTALALWTVRTRPYLLVGWLWFVGVLVPMIGLRQSGVQAMADRFAYVPLVGLLLLFVWTLGEWLGGSARRQRTAGVVAGASILAFALVSNLQTGYWRDSTSLWRRAIVIDPNNYLAHGNLSAAGFALQQVELTRVHAAEAVRLHPAFIEMHVRLGVLALVERKTDEARRHFEDALRCKRDAPAAFKRLAAAAEAHGDLDSAFFMLSVSTTLMPGDLEGRLQLAMFLESRGRSPEAVAQFREVLRQQPDVAFVQNELAWILATCANPAVRNAADAVTLAERACQLTERRHARCLGTLAAAYAESGRFEDAVRTASEAIVVAGSAGENDVAERNRLLLELYRAGKPYHAPAR